MESVWDVQECPADALDGIRKAATTLAAKDPLWRCGRVLLQTGSAAALLQDGVVRRIWVGKVPCHFVPLWY